MEHGRLDSALADVDQGRRATHELTLTNDLLARLRVMCLDALVQDVEPSHRDRLIVTVQVVDRLRKALETIEIKGVNAQIVYDHLIERQNG